jgi:hypothetical protein
VGVVQFTLGFEVTGSAWLRRLCLLAAAAVTDRLIQPPPGGLAPVAAHAGATGDVLEIELVARMPASNLRRRR